MDPRGRQNWQAELADFVIVMLMLGEKLTILYEGINNHFTGNM